MVKRLFCLLNTFYIFKRTQIMNKRRQYLSIEDDANKSGDAFVSPVVAPPPSLNVSFSVSGGAADAATTQQNSCAPTVQTARSGASDCNKYFTVVSSKSASMELAKKRLEM